MSPHPLQARDVLLSVERSRQRTLSQQIQEQLREAIRSGTLGPGRRLPSTRALAADLSVSRGVILRAYEQLSVEGYLDLRQGATPRVRVVNREQQGPPGAHPPSGPRVQHDLRGHLPDLPSFPRREWLRSLRNVLSGGARNADFGYIDPQGLTTLRMEVADYLGRARGVAADVDKIVIATGVTHGLSLICRVLARGGVGRLGFENPSHALLHRVSERAGLEPVGVAVDSSGVVVEALVEADIRAVIVAPAHQFPLGVPLATERRRDLVEWVQDGDRLVIEDDYDAAFRYDRAPVGSLQGLAPDSVAYVGSTGKTLAPGIRIGWAVLPDRLVEPVVEELASSILHVSGIDQLAFADFMRRGEFDRHLRRMRAIYKRRRDLLVGELERQLPDRRVGGIAAGLHVVLELSSSAEEAAAVAYLREEGLRIQSVSRHALANYHGPHGLLIGYGTLSEPTIPLVTKRIAAVINRVVREARICAWSRLPPACEQAASYG